jgi:hypothetical protein
METCYKTKPDPTKAESEAKDNNGDCKIDTDFAQTCDIEDDFKVQIFSLDESDIRGLTKPMSLGYQIVTREQIQCLG